MTLILENLAGFDKSFRVGNKYADKGKWMEEKDELNKWLHNGSKTIANAGGIRYQSYDKIDLTFYESKTIPPYMILMTAQINTEFDNPWKDNIDMDNKIIKYWGDAKYKAKKSVLDFRGNNKVFEIWKIKKKYPELYPPFLHFTKVNRGVVKFNGVCFLKQVEVRKFEDKLNPVENLLLILEILDINPVPVKWLLGRSLAKDVNDLKQINPQVFNNALQGNLKKLKAF